MKMNCLKIFNQLRKRMHEFQPKRQKMFLKKTYFGAHVVGIFLAIIRTTAERANNQNALPLFR